MENNGEAVDDDQGSGWLEVKKKHRSSSKFSLQGWVGGFSGKHPSKFPHSRPLVNEKVGNSHGKHKSSLQKAGGDFTTCDLGRVSVSCNEGAFNYDKCNVNQDNISSTLAPSGAMIVTNTTSRPGDMEEDPQKDMPVAAHKIKWGDIEDDALVLHYEKTAGAEIKFGDIDNDNLMVYRTSENANMISCRSSSTEVQGNELVKSSGDVGITPQQMNSLSWRDKSSEENCKEANEISLKNVEMQLELDRVVDEQNDVSNCKEIYDRLVDENDDVLNCKKIYHEHTNAIDGDPLIFSCPSREEVLMMEKIGVPDESEVGDSKTSEEPIINGGSITVVISQTTELLAGKSTPETLAESSMTTFVEGCRSPQNGIIDDDMSRSQMTGDLGDGVGDAGESKERFRQRLWCFLFENLNRAVDELYLLCELECDLEQVKEAILVLEEAAADFKELKSRVQEFENVKKSSPQLLDGMPVTLKTDHRRPHALSWEVRRMTTSPHRAEILSSSLEAFKKVQHERASMTKGTNARTLRPNCPNHHHISGGVLKKSAGGIDVTPNAKDSGMKSTKQSGGADLSRGNLSGDKRNTESGRSSKVNLVQNGYIRLQNSSTLDPYASRLSLKDSSAAPIPAKCKKEQSGLTSEKEKLLPKKDKLVTDSNAEKNPKFMDHLKRNIPLSEKDKEKRNASSWNAWKEKRNWEDILASPFRVSSRVSHSPGMSRKSAERARILRDKLMSPEKKKKTAVDLKKEAEEKHARAMRIRGELENERVQKLQRTSEKLNRVNEWQAVRSIKLREGMDARHQRSVSRHEAFLAQVVRRAGDESSKVNEVRFITSLNEENKKFILRQKLHDSELRRAEKLQMMKSKQREDMAREEAVLERRKLIEAEKLQRLAETQRKKEEAQVRREEERRLSSVAREAKSIEQLRRKEIRAKAQQEEAELLAQKLAERLSESEQRRKFYLEQIRERASMDFRDQSSPLLRRSLNKESQGRSTPTNNGDDCQANNISGSGVSTTHATGNVALQHLLKRKIKRIRQRLMALKYEFSEPPVNNENSGIGYKTAVGTARAKIGRWLQELQRLRQARKEGAASIGLITAEMVKFLEGRDPELLASRQAGLLDFIASALPASHTSKPGACQVTIYLLRLLRVVLSLPANRSYFLSQNLLPPIIPMLSAALENYIKIAASLNVPGCANSLLSKTSVENFESISEVLDGFLWTVITIIGHVTSDERQLQMQDGLLDLVVAYQVIHRLRDLFALYDRPQVEGSPFPSSILLSINLLMVLTSRPRTISSIDWESFPSATGSGNDTQETRILECTDVGFSFVNNYNGDCRPPLSVVNGSVVMHLPDVPEDRPLDESCETNRIDEPGSFEELTSITVNLNDVNHDTIDATDESQKNVNIAKSLEREKDEKSSMDSGGGGEQKNENILASKQPQAFLLSAISETGLVSLPSMLTAVLLQANNRLSSEQASYVLPSNFEEVAAGVLKVLNNLALIDITLMQKMLARPDLKMEFFHLMSFLLSHCTSKWKVAGDQVGLLLLESLLLLGYFALFHPGNQAVLRWGKTPTILHKVCDLPFVFFSDPDLMPILAGTLVAACFGCEQNKGVVQQELSVDMLLSLLTSCKNSLPTIQSNSTRDKSPTDDCGECNQLVPELKKFQVEAPLKPSRCNARSARVSSGKGNSSVNSSRIAKLRNQRESKATKGFEDYTLKRNQHASETSSILMLHGRFPRSFIDRAEHFFSASSNKSAQ